MASALPDRPSDRIEAATDDLVRALVDGAAVRMERGHFDAALCELANALRLRPRRTDILQSMGAACAALGDQEAAFACRRNTIPAVLERRFPGLGGTAAEASPRAPIEGLVRNPAYEPRPVPLPVPPGNDASEAWPQFARRTTVPNVAFTDAVEEGCWWFDGFNTSVVDRNGTPIEPHCRGNASLALTASSVSVPRRLNGTACVLDARSARIYYHWLVDVLPKLAVLEASGVDLASVDHWVVRADRPFQRDTLSFLGVPSARVVEWRGPEQYLVADRLVVPYLKNDIGDRPATALGLGMGEWVPTWLRDRFVPTPASEPCRRLYVSRAARGTRNIANESALVEALTARGFETVTLEDMSVSEQAALMNEADVVLGPHGAGLTNTAFCRPGTLLVELFGAYVVPCYWALANLSGLEYRRFMCHRADAPDSAGAVVTDARDATLNVRVPELLALLDPLLACRRVRRAA